MGPSSLVLEGFDRRAERCGTGTGHALVSSRDADERFASPSDLSR